MINITQSYIMNAFPRELLRLLCKYLDIYHIRGYICTNKYINNCLYDILDVVSEHLNFFHSIIHIHTCITVYKYLNVRVLQSISIRNGTTAINSSIVRILDHYIIILRLRLCDWYIYSSNDLRANYFVVVYYAWPFAVLHHQSHSIQSAINVIITSPHSLPRINNVLAIELNAICLRLSLSRFTYMRDEINKLLVCPETVCMLVD